MNIINLDHTQYVDIEQVALKFFNLVLPSRGVFACAVKSRRRRWTVNFSQSHADLWSECCEADLRGDESYFTVASLKSNEGRQGSNVDRLKSLRLDVDVSGEAYVTSADAQAAILEFLKAVRMPRPLIVLSGGGFHLYWPLAQELEPDLWLPYARGLKSLCIQHGFRADHAVTADLARILRPPGTHNRKLAGAPRQVEVVRGTRGIEAVQPIALERLAHLKDASEGISKGAEEPTGKVFHLGPLPDFLAHSRLDVGLAQRLFNASAQPAALAAVVADHCRQIGFMRDTRGQMPEPTWYAALGVLAFCEDGDELGHEWSKGDERYDPRQVDDKLSAWRRMSGPATCARFQSLDDAARRRCEACEYRGKITSPAEFGQAAPVVRDPLSEARGFKSPQLWSLTAKGTPKERDYMNAKLAIEKLGISAAHDVFHDRKIIKGDLPENLGNKLSDSIVRAIRAQIVRSFHFDPGKEHVQEVLETMCEANRYDPIVDYLDGLVWDGKPRLDTLLSTYFGAEDTPLHRAFGAKTMIGGVRRVREPGCKFDTMLVLEGRQGAGKSRALAILARSPENFTDQNVRYSDSRQQAETFRGVWIVEFAELAGLRKAEVEHAKSLLSRQRDMVRLAYGRYRDDIPRRCIFIGTTNGGKDAGYLNDPSGGRRFWPVQVGQIDLEALELDADQLWAEAAYREAKGEPLVLPEGLYEPAAEQQALRREHNPFVDQLAHVVGTRHETARGVLYQISSRDVMTSQVDGLGLSAAQLNSGVSRLVADAMRQLGWAKIQMRVIRKDGGSSPVQGWERATIGAQQSATHQSPHCHP